MLFGFRLLLTVFSDKIFFKYTTDNEYTNSARNTREIYGSDRQTSAMISVMEFRQDLRDLTDYFYVSIG